MPRIGDYSNCKIYKITSMNNPELVYYGHTCDTLSRRFSTHKAPLNPTKSKTIIEKGDAIILLVEEYPCQNKYEAKAREAFYILNNHCINKQVPNRTTQEYYEDKKEHILEKVNQYRKQHRELIIERKKKFYENNREEILKHNKLYRDNNKYKLIQYYEDNKEHILEQKRIYRETHREQINEKQREKRRLKKEQMMETV